MGLASRHAFPPPPTAARVRTPPRAVLPAEIAFLAGMIDASILWKAARTARRQNVCAARALIADGGLTEKAFYRAVAQKLGLSFEDGWPDLAPNIDLRSAIRAGCVEIAGGGSTRWLVAPQGPELGALLSGQLAYAHSEQVAIVTPAHLAALVHYRAQRAVEEIATHELPNNASKLSARDAIGPRTWPALTAIAACVVLGLCAVPHIVGDLFGVLFFGGIILRLLTAAGAWMAVNPRAPRLSDAFLPTYTVLVPLHREAEVLPDLLAALSTLDYPRAKLEVLILIEPEDHTTRAALAAAQLPPWLQVVIAPRCRDLRTKPRALNVGLAVARGELLTVYDAEDRPDPDQLRRAAERFGRDAGLACLQAKLAIVDGDRSRLAGMFAIEYAGLFDVLNIGTTALGLPLALGGTSNHFRTAVLRAAGGWDAWNVTEDADLGLRLARLGYRVGSLDSTTYETAPKNAADWLNQRRRWLKGWMQTFLVLSRDAPSVLRDLGPIRGCALVFMLTNMAISPLCLPAFTALMLHHLAMNGLPTPTGLSELFEATLAACVPLYGIGGTLWIALVGMIRRRPARLASLPLFLLYQLMISVAAAFALWDLIMRPFHWHKTPHARHEA